MSFFWGDGFDCYALPADALLGYWDSGTTNAVLVSGRFSGSRGWSHNAASATTAGLVKSSGSNDAVHHLVLAINQSAAITGTNLYHWFTLLDGATAQCSIVFRGDGAILLTSGASNGTVLATYAGAFTASNTWYAFEIEVVINNTTGSIAIRKNGNTSNDFSATSLNTRGGTANNYANRLAYGNGTGAINQTVDDLLWRSDAASVPWVGDIRCYTRRPASDAAVQWSQSGSAAALFQSSVQSNPISSSATIAVLCAFTVIYPGTINTVTVVSGAGITGNVKAAIYSDVGGVPSAILASLGPIAAVAAGNNDFTVSPPLAVTVGQRIWIAWIASGGTGTWNATSGTVTDGGTITVAYATFPQASPVYAASRQYSARITFGMAPGNYALVQEPQQDAAASYVYSSTVGQADLYTLTGIDTTPTVIIGVTTRGLLQKSDAGTRNVAVQLKSGGTTVESASAALNTVFGWVYRTDLTDPATGAAWTPVGVNSANIGVVVKV